MASSSLRTLDMRPALVGLFFLLTGGTAAAQYEDYSRLGLSAAPDHYVSTVEVNTDVDDEFTLYMLAQGPDGLDSLPFDLVSLDWAIHTPCCGASYDLTYIEYNPQLDHAGFPFTGVQSSSEVCLSQDYVLLATLRFRIFVPQAGVYRIPAGAIGPAIDCDGGSHFFLDLWVDAYVNTSTTADQDHSWGSVKALYR